MCRIWTNAFRASVPRINKTSLAQNAERNTRASQESLPRNAARNTRALHTASTELADTAGRFLADRSASLQSRFTAALGALRRLVREQPRITAIASIGTCRCPIPPPSAGWSPRAASSPAGGRFIPQHTRTATPAVELRTRTAAHRCHTVPLTAIQRFRNATRNTRAARIWFLLTSGSTTLTPPPRCTERVATSAIYCDSRRASVNHTRTNTHSGTCRPSLTQCRAPPAIRQRVRARRRPRGRPHACQRAS